VGVRILRFEDVLCLRVRKIVRASPKQKGERRRATNWAQGCRPSSKFQALPAPINTHHPPSSLSLVLTTLVPTHGLIAAREKGATSAAHRSSLEGGNWLVLLTTTNRRIYNSARIALAVAAASSSSSSRTGRSPGQGTNPTSERASERTARLPTGERTRALPGDTSGAWATNQYHEPRVGWDLWKKHPSVLEKTPLVDERRLSRRFAAAPNRSYRRRRRRHPRRRHRRWR
jgi:hypothetical protein